MVGGRANIETGGAETDNAAIAGEPNDFKRNTQFAWARLKLQRGGGRIAIGEDFLWLDEFIVLDPDDSAGANKGAYKWVIGPERWLVVPDGASMALTLEFSLVNAHANGIAVNVARSLAPNLINTDASFEDCFSTRFTLVPPTGPNFGNLQVQTGTILATSIGANLIPAGTLRIWAKNLSIVGAGGQWQALRLRAHARFFNV